MLKSADKIEIKMLGKEERYTECYKKVFKLYNTISDLNIIEKNFLLYNLAWVCKKLNIIEESKIYIQQTLDNIMSVKGYQTEKGKALWLYIELYKEELNKDELENLYKELKMIFSFMENDSEIILGIDGNIAILNNDWDKLINIISISISHNYIYLLNSVKSDILNLDKEIREYINNNTQLDNII